jgi:hypothetical protein
MVTNRSVGRPYGAGQEAVSVAELQLARVAEVGCVRHPHLNALIEGSGVNSGRDLADAIHLLCALHGRPPAMIEVAHGRSDGAAREWLEQASDAFERERLLLVQLTAAVGPVPSTPGAAETEAALLAQRNAIEILALSERRGCALGAATALVGDWWPLRRLLDRAAQRAGIDCPAPSLPDEDSVVAVIGTGCDTAASERALAFGAEQLLLQHRGLFDLLEARAEARSEY